MGSPAYQLSKDDVLKVAKGAGLAAAGVVLTWLSYTALPILQQGGGWDAIVESSDGLAQMTIAAALSVVINALRKLVTDTRPEPPQQEE